MTHVGDEAYKHIGSDWIVAILLGVAAIARSIAYLVDGHLLEQADFLSLTVGTDGAAGIWALAGFSILASIPLQKIRRMTIALHVALYAAWSVSLGAYFIATSSQAVHAAAINFGLIAVLVIWGLSRVRLTDKEMPPLPREIMEEVNADGRHKR